MPVFVVFVGRLSLLPRPGCQKPGQRFRRQITMRARCWLDLYPVALPCVGRRKLQFPSAQHRPSRRQQIGQQDSPAPSRVRQERHRQEGSPAPFKDHHRRGDNLDHFRDHQERPRQEGRLVPFKDRRQERASPAPFRDHRRPADNPPLCGDRQRVPGRLSSSLRLAGRQGRAISRQRERPLRERHLRAWTRGER